MGYYIRSDKKNQTQAWRVQYITYQKKYAKESNAKKPRKEWNIPKRRWQSLGFQESMSIEQAQSRAWQLNTHIEKRRQEERRKKLEDEHVALETKFMSALPHVYKTEFEQKYLYGRFNNAGWRRRFQTSWRAAQRMLIEIPVDPVDWFDDSHLFYDYFYKKKYSFSYIKKVLLVTNLWGHFLARRLGQTFIRIPIPRGVEKARLLEAYFNKCGGRTNHSDPLTPDQLEAEKSKLKPEYYNWLYLSIWFGLRPQEVDQLKKEEYKQIRPSFHGVSELRVYQTKLVSVPPRYRWKVIPTVCDEQIQALDIVRSGNFKRPSVKTVRKYFGDHTTLYGGRKGFVDLMLSRDQDFVHISQWMGHSSIERTWRNYKSRLLTHYRPPAEKAA